MENSFGYILQKIPIHPIVYLLKGDYSAKCIAADAHDAGRVPEFRPNALQLMLMMWAGSWSFGQMHCS